MRRHRSPTPPGGPCQACAVLPRGFTLIELMMVVGIVGILAAMSIGFTGTYFKEQKLKEVARGVQSAISLARAEAVRTSSTITVILSTPRLIVFKDVNNNGTFDLGDTMIFRYPAATAAALPVTTAITSADFPSSSGSVYPTLYFNYEGLSVGDTGLRSGKICVKDANVTEVRAVQMTVAGACRIQSRAAAKLLCP
jgi:prepilin-type N-terminal cleavage/methylation domain-containing protein